MLLVFIDLGSRLVKVGSNLDINIERFNRDFPGVDTTSSISEHICRNGQSLRVLHEFCYTHEYKMLLS
jgi:hypothetical protein